MEVREEIKVYPVPTVAELAVALASSIDEVMALSPEDRGELIFSLILERMED